MLWCQRVEFLMQIVIPYLCDVESQRRTIFISNYQKLGFGGKCLERVLETSPRHNSVESDSMNTNFCLLIANAHRHNASSLLKLNCQDQFDEVEAKKSKIKTVHDQLTHF